MSETITIRLSIEDAREVFRSVEFCKDVARGLEPVPSQNLLDQRPTVPALRFLDNLHALLLQEGRPETASEFRGVIVGLGFHERGGDRDPGTEECIYNLALLGKKLFVLKVLISDDERYAPFDRHVDVRYIDPDSGLDIARASFFTHEQPDSYTHALDFIRSYAPR